MGDGRLEAAKEALLSLVGRLDPTDNFGLVVFSDEAAVAVPAGPLRDKRRRARGDPLDRLRRHDEPVGRLSARRSRRRGEWPARTERRS